MWCDILKLDQIGVRNRFFELGGDSIRAALFINTLQEALKEFIYVVTVFESSTVEQYAAFLEKDYAKSVAAWLGTDDQPGQDRANGDHALGQTGRIDEEMGQHMRSLVPRLRESAVNDGDNEAKNPRAIFILAPPRSGTTLLRVMLAGHPRLFAATELQLLSFNTLAERKHAFTGKFSAWLDGTIRAIMELKQCGPDEAKQIMREFEDQDCSTRDFYRVLQDWCGDRVLLDKTPHYALDPEALRKAERDFHEPFYIHLVRHPYAMVRSFEKQHMDQVLFLEEHDFNAHQLGELVWTVSHQVTLAFLNDVSRERQFRLRFEDLLREPRRSMESLCKTLGLDFHADLLEPYKNQERKLVDGIYADSTPMGDVNFLRHQRIDPQVADRWKLLNGDDSLGDVTWELANGLGYTRPNGSSKSVEQWGDRIATARDRKERLGRRRAQRRRTRELGSHE